MIEYYNQNEIRAYPLYENSLRMSLDGTELPNDLLVDLAVTAPEGLSGFHLSSLVMTPTLISISVAHTSGGLLVGTFPRPVVVYRPYALTGVVPLTSGYVVFGGGATSRSDLRFISNDAERSGLDFKVVRQIAHPVVLSIGRYRSVSEGLTGIVNLEVAPGMTIRFDEGKIKVGLADNGNRSSFVNPCDLKAIFEECGSPPIRTINGVAPDENGIITLEVKNG